MKPTEKDAIAAAQEYIDRLSIVSGNEFKSIPMAFRQGAKWASGVQPGWIENIPLTENAAEILRNTDLNLIICELQDGSIVRFTEKHASKMVRFFVLPQPPTKP